MQPNGAYLNDEGQFMVLTDHYIIEQNLIDYLATREEDEICRRIVTRWQQSVLAEHMSPLQKECTLKEMDDLYTEHHDYIEKLIKEYKESKNK